MKIEWYSATIGRFERPVLVVLGVEPQRLERSFAEAWIIPPTQEHGRSEVHIARMGGDNEGAMVGALVKELALDHVKQLAIAHPNPVEDLQLSVFSDWERLQAWVNMDLYFQSFRAVAAMTDYADMSDSLRAYRRVPFHVL